MGYLITGINEGTMPFSTSQPITIIAWLLIFIMPIITLSIMYFVQIEFTTLKTYTRMMTGLLFVSLIHQSIQAAFCAFDTLPLLEFWYTWVGILQLGISVLVQIELLSVFSVLTTFWTRSRVVGLRICFVMVYVILSIPSYFTLSNNPAIVDYWDECEHWAAALMGSLVSLYDFIQTCYILFSVYRYAKQNHEKESLDLLKKPIVRFLACIAGVLIVDFISANMYLSYRVNGRPFAVIGLQMIHARFAVSCYAFFYMKSITKIIHEQKLSIMDTRKVTNLKTVLIQGVKQQVSEVVPVEMEPMGEPLNGLFSIGGGYDASKRPSITCEQNPKAASSAIPKVPSIASNSGHSKAPSIRFEPINTKALSITSSKAQSIKIEPITPIIQSITFELEQSKASLPTDPDHIIAIP
jgi:hypothetical protein